MITLKKKIQSLLLVFIISIAALLSLYYYLPDTFVLSSPYSSDELLPEIEKIYNIRNNALMTGNPGNLINLFDTSQKYGQWSLEHEVRRVKYLRDWSQARGIKFTNIHSFVRIKRIYNTKNTTKIALEESYRFDYIYPKDENPALNSFGVGLRHTLSLIKKDDCWLVYSDWYTDCFEDAMQRYSGEIRDTEDTVQPDEEEDNEQYSETYNVKIRPYYNRQKAVEYADKYCGAAWGSGNDYKYNKRYSDYNGIGGDCTNFVSQVLGDKEAGGLPQDGIWHCSGPKNGRCSGSRAWVNTDGLKDYLLYSGKGSVIKKGTYKDLTEPIQDYPGGAVTKLLPGDLICYEKKGNIDHFAVITAHDSHGYPLVNSHTADRYHVPWDLGWGDKGIRFFLIHING